MLFTSNQERGVVLLRSELTADGPLLFSRLLEWVERVRHKSLSFAGSNTLTAAYSARHPVLFKCFRNRHGNRGSGSVIEDE